MADMDDLADIDDLINGDDLPDIDDTSCDDTCLLTKSSTSLLRTRTYDLSRVRPHIRR